MIMPIIAYSNLIIGFYEPITDCLIDNINNVTEILKKYDNKITFIGNGSIIYKDVIEFKLKNNAIFSTNNDLSAYSVGITAFSVYSHSKINDSIYNISPLYIRPSSAEQLLSKKR